MTNVLIIGAGSIGNHLAYACRNKEWQVDVVDIDKKALARMKDEIYPARYGSWDQAISLYGAIPDGGSWDIVIIGTPPDTHTSVAIDLLKKHSPKVLLIEKPLTTPSMLNQDELTNILNKSETKGLVGFNHNVTDNTKFIEKLIAEKVVGKPATLEVKWFEDWSGIFKAHPWLDGPADSYLGFLSRGGGACCEHSHAIALWVHLSRLLDLGSVAEVEGQMKMINTEGLYYDEETSIQVKTEKGILGSIKQDVKTMPAIKMARIEGDEGYIEWFANFEDGRDLVKWSSKGGVEQSKTFPKSRPDDFKNEINLLEEIMHAENDYRSPIDYEIGLQVAIITNKAIASSKAKKVVTM